MIRFLFFILFVIFSTIPTLAQSASVELNIIIQEYLSIQCPNQTLIANVRNDNGALDQPISTRFRVITNTNNTKTLYLKSTTITEDGVYNSMFNINGVTYLAFGNISNQPKHRELINCINGMDGKNVIAYPITFINGAKYKYINSKYEVYIENGIADLVVVVGTNPLFSSFTKNDTKGFYQTTLHLTETDL